MPAIKTVDDFAHEVVRVVKSNLEVLLLLGSRMRVAETIFSDYDFICVLKRHNVRHLTRLRNLVAQTSFYTDMPVMFCNEIPDDPNEFSVANQGCYYLEVLKRARVLHGQNIFLEYSSPTPKALRFSLIQKIFEYHMNMRRQYVDANRSLSPVGNYMINRRMIKAVQDLEWALGNDPEMAEQFLVKQFLERYPKVLTTRQRELLHGLIDPDNVVRYANDLSDIFLFQWLLVMEKITKVARRITT